jgi:phage terminase small subunit
MCPTFSEVAMGRRGTKPKPTTLKLLAGVHPYRVNGSEPIAPAGIPDPPGYLDGRALELWQELAPMLASMGVLTLADRHALALLCDSYSRWREKPADDRRRTEFRRLLAEFGLTPSSRSSIKVAPAPPEDRLAEFLKQRR